LFSPSEALVVGQPAKFACLGNWSNLSVPSDLGFRSAPVSFQSRADAVDQPVNWQIWFNETVAFDPSERRPVGLQSFAICPPSPFDFVGVGYPLSNPVESLSDVRRTEARSAGIDRPAGVARSFQVSLYKVEPAKSVLARNLLAKDDCRSAVLNKPVEVRP
jgi:hypothetical protein